MFIAKKSVVEECERYLKSLYLSRTGYPGHYKYKYYEPDGVSHSGNGGEKSMKKGYTSRLRDDLKNNLRDSFGLHINKKTGIVANLSGDSVNKMGSEKAIEKSKANGFSVEEHFEVANRIVELYENADLKETRPDKNNSPDLKSIKRFDSEVALKSGKKAIAHITVKESVLNGHKIYSVEVMDLE